MEYCSYPQFADEKTEIKRLAQDQAANKWFGL